MQPIVRDVIVERLRAALEAARDRDLLPLQTMPDIAVEHPQNPKHGDFANSLPLRLARATRIEPMTIAETLVEQIPLGEELERVWAEPPGFVNFFSRSRGCAARWTPFSKGAKATAPWSLATGRR